MQTKCERVIIIGLDGAGNAISQANTPRIDQLLSKGVVTHKGQTEYPSISAECWGSLFHGVSADKHKLTNESITNNPFPEDSPYPSFMKLARAKWPNCKLAAFSKWAPINTGIIEQSSDCHLVSKPDAELVAEFKEYILNEDAKIIGVFLDDIDHAGHKHGYRSEKYIKQIESHDALVGEMIDGISDAGYMEDTLIILCSDHGGGGAEPNNHGSSHPLDMTITWGCVGPGVQEGGVIEEQVNIKDTAAVIAQALGLEKPIGWDNKVPKGVLEEAVRN